MKVDHVEDYRDRRFRETPSQESQLDALMRGGQALENMKKKTEDLKIKYVSILAD